MSSTLRVVDLAGDVKDSTDEDQNVFDIRQPVAITLLVDTGDARDLAFGIERIRGSRPAKEIWLLSAGVPTESPSELTPRPPDYLFDSFSVGSEYSGFLSLPALFQEATSGVKTNRDGVVLNYELEGLRDQLAIFADRRVSDREVSELLGVESNAQWDLPSARRALGRGISEELFGTVAYRPFDTKWIYYDGRVVTNPRPVLQRSVWNKRNLVLITVRRARTPGWAHAWVTRDVPMAELISSADNCHAFPLFLYQEAMLEGLQGTPNLASSELGETDPERALAYVYAVLYSPTYRRRYQGRLRTDLPRIPNCEDGELRSRLVDLGRELVALHLLELPRVAKPIRTYLGPKSPQVERVGWSDDTVWLDARGALRDRAGSVGFQGVPEAVWNFKVGSYQVCEKWLKDRTGQTLSKEEIAHFERIVVATSETLRVMTEIDEVIEIRGGWPSAFRR